jgi:hypothetical protein
MADRMLHIETPIDVCARFISCFKADIINLVVSDEF